LFTGRSRGVCAFFEPGRITIDHANALGYRDRCFGCDADARRETLSRFEGRPRHTRAYWSGFYEADSYVENHYRWGANSRRGRACDATRMQHASKSRLRSIA